MVKNRRLVTNKQALKQLQFLCYETLRIPCSTVQAKYLRSSHNINKDTSNNAQNQ